jgi:hypothetical protein
VPVRDDAAGVEAVARGGFHAGPVVVRGALSAGAEWRRVRLDPPTRIDSPERRYVVAMLGGEAEVLVPLLPWLRLSVFASVRGWPTATGLTWMGRTAYDPPRVGAGAGVRFGALLPGRPR